MRGDNASRTSVPAPSFGSPPRAWGQWDAMRKTPRRSPVHPHVRGDNGFREGFESIDIGSPPRACGQSVRSDGAADAGTVHPHVRGDNGRHVELL